MKSISAPECNKFATRNTRVRLVTKKGANHHIAAPIETLEIVIEVGDKSHLDCVLGPLLQAGGEMHDVELSVLVVALSVLCTIKKS